MAGKWEPTKVGKGHLKLHFNLMAGREHTRAQQLPGMCCASSQMPPKPWNLTLQLLHHLYSWRSSKWKTGEVKPLQTSSQTQFTQLLLIIKCLGGIFWNANCNKRSQVLLAATIILDSSSLRDGYRARVEEWRLLKHNSLVHQVNKLGRW